MSDSFSFGSAAMDLDDDVGQNPGKQKLDAQGDIGDSGIHNQKLFHFQLPHFEFCSICEIQIFAGCEALFFFFFKN